MAKVFLGGTCSHSKWRDLLIENKAMGAKLEIDYFNPVVVDWKPECQAEEIKQREECDYILYVITPRMSGVYSIAEVVEDSIKRPEKTIFAIINADTLDDVSQQITHFSDSQLKSLKAVAGLVKRNGATVLNSLKQIRDYLNSKA